MAINDYQCPEHGVFEAHGPHCPHCGAKSEIIHLRAPVVGHDTRKFVDQHVERMLGEFGLGDLPKQIDSREKVTEVRRLHSSASTPLPQAPGTAPPGQISVPVPNVASLGAASEAGNQAFASIQGGRADPVSREVSRARSAGTRRPPVSVAISDKR